MTISNNNFGNPNNKNRDIFIERMRRFDKPHSKLLITDFNTDWINQVIDYCVAYNLWKRGFIPAPPSKALFVVGYHGSGKTFVTERCAKVLRARQEKLSGYGIRGSSFEVRSELADIADAAKDLPVWIDDLGTEGNELGCPDGPVAAMLVSLVDWFKTRKHPIIITSNIAPANRQVDYEALQSQDPLSIRYGTRAGYRLWKHFQTIYTGKKPFGEEQ